jgi:hypothetical protein
MFYDFKYSKFAVQNELNRVINEDSGFSVPNKWIDAYKVVNIESMFVYFKRDPEEMYEIGFTGDAAVWQKSTTSRLALVYQFDGVRWRKESELSGKEEDRITKRFEDEILSKIKYKYSISY